MANVLLPPVDHETVETNGIHLHAVTAGPPDGPPVVLLHGFPEFWYGWRHQIPALVDAGYRVIVPDQRGYNRSDKPEGIEAYTIDRPVDDALGLLDALGYERAHFVGHDWGAGVTWQILLRYPKRVRRAVTMNAPHPRVFEEFFYRRPSQVRKSWYVFFFQLPRLPEWLARVADWRGLRWFPDTSNREDAFTESELVRYREAWSRPGALTGMINWYRAMVRKRVAEPSTSTVVPPTMLVWGTQDQYLHRGMAGPSIDRCEKGRFEPIEDATHWVQHDVPDRVNDLLLEFLEQ